MVIVMTAMVAWYLAGPQGHWIGKVETPAARTKAVEGQVPAAAKVGLTKALPPPFKDASRPFHPVALNRYQERLLKDAVMIDQRRMQARGSEPAREVRLWRTDFKYPLVREETILELDANGRLQPVRRDFSVADHAMVKFPEGVTQKQMNAWAKKHGLTFRHTLKTTSVKLVAAAEESLDTTDRIMAAFRQDFPMAAQQAAVAERDSLVFPTLLPDDTSLSQLWGMHNTGQTGGTPDADIDAMEAWDLTTGSREILVGVIDTGVDRNHPDLAPNMWRNPNETPGNGLDDDRNGFVDDVNGWDFFANDNDPMDENNHGTHCSGTIGGVGNNLAGVTGVCWQVSIVGIRFLGPSGGSSSDAIECVNYSRSLGVDLTSNSWGGGGFSALLQAAIVHAGQADQLFIAAAGNDAANTDFAPQYPAGYAADNIVSVAASTDRDSLSSFSNYGRTTVDLAAPGSSILSTVKNGGYSTFSGTSMATPHVAGAIALLKSLVPGIPASEIKSQLLTTVDPLPALTTTTSSGGRLNVERLMTQSAGPRPIVSVTTIEEQPGGNGDGISNPGEALALRFSVNNRGAETAQNVRATLKSSLSNSSYSITRGEIHLGDIEAGQILASPTTFLVRSQALTLTPYAEEFLITLHYGLPREETVHRVTLYLHSSSRIAGRVTRIADGSPIEDAQVSLIGPATQSIQTDADGRYAIIVTDGVYQISASAAEFVPSLEITKTAPPGAEGVDFSLGAPQLHLTPDAVVAHLFTNLTARQFVEMRNDGTAPLAWSLKVNNRQEAATLTQKRFTLPARQILGLSEIADGGFRTSFKTQDYSTVPALEVPLASLIGRTIGAVSTSWDRSVLIGDLQARGARVVTINLPLTNAALDVVDALIVDDSIADFSATDMDLLRERVEAGTGVLCEADNASSIHRINEFFAATGIEAVSESFRDLRLSDIRTHPMTTGVTALQEFAVGASAAITASAQVLVQDPNGRAHAAVSRLGKGVVVFVGNEISDSSSFESADARRFVNQIIDGLSGQVSWLAPGAYSGYIRPGNQYLLPLGFSAQDQAAGTYQAEITFDTNIPNKTNDRLPITMIVTDAPRIVGNTDSLSFGSVVEGVLSNQTLTLTNAGQLPLHVSRVFIEGADAAFFNHSISGPFQLAPSAKQNVIVTLNAAAPKRQHHARLIIHSDDPTRPIIEVALTGARQDPPDLVMKAKEVFLQLRQGKQGYAECILENEGKGILAWQSSLPESPPWVQVTGAGGSLNPKARGTIRLNYDASILSAGDYLTHLRLVTNDVDTPVSLLPVKMRILAEPLPRFDSYVSFPNTIVGEQSQASIQITNLGSADWTVHNIISFAASFSCISPLPFKVPAGQTRFLSLRFKPTQVGPAAGSLILSGNTSERLSFLIVSGMGIHGPKIRVSSPGLNFSSAPAATVQRTLTITNTGDLPLRWSSTLIGEANWLSMSPASGNVGRGNTQVIQLGMNSRNLPSGVYTSKLRLLSNDKSRPAVDRPIRMQVTSSGAIGLSETSLVFPEIWTGAMTQKSVTISNIGNAAFDVLSMVSSSSRLRTDAAAPFTLGPGAQLPVTFFYRSSEEGYFNDTFKIRTSIKTNQVVTLPVQAEFVRPPSIEVNPTKIEEMVNPGQWITRDMTVKNDGGAALHWTSSLRDGTGPVLPLSNVLTQFNANTVLLLAKVPSPYAFPEGITGDKITEPTTNGVWNGGNIHATNLASGTVIPYSDNTLGFHAAVGSAGRYFTRKINTLFLFAADLDQVTNFKIEGHLSTAGLGTAEVSSFKRTIAGVVYRGFFKQVHGLNLPAVNHLIMVEDKPELNQRSSSDTSLDEHEVTGLSGKTRLYHLLFCTLQGRKVTETEVTALMDSFLLNTAHSMQPEWLRLMPDSGTVAAKSQQAQALQIDTRTLPGGTYGATLRLNSNAVGRSQIEVPISVNVPFRSLLIADPESIKFPDIYADASNYQTCVLQNVGNLPITLTSIESSEAVLTVSGMRFPTTLQPRESGAVNVLFAPKSVADFTGTLTVMSAGQAAPALLIPMAARATLGPRLETLPASLEVNVDPGNSVIETIHLTNKGGAALKWNASLSSNLTSLITLSRSSGTTIPNARSALNLTVRTDQSTTAQTTSGSVTLVSDDPSHPIVTIPVRMTVRAVPRLTLSPPVASFADTFVQSTSTQTLTLRNTGNAELTISNIASTDSQFGWAAISTPLQLDIGASITMTLRFSPTNLGSYSAEFRFTTNQPGSSEVVLAVLGKCVTPPSIRVQPDEVAITLSKGGISAQNLSVMNDGGTVLDWQTFLQSPEMPSGNLQDILQRVNDHYSEMTHLIPDIYSFTEGVSGSAINDGGGDMYDSGNILGTNFSSTIPYSDNQVIAGQAVGLGGQYFTRKREGLFIFAADLDRATSFTIRGDLGADGYGQVSGSVLTRTHHGLTYKGFFKCVSGTTDPSVNHLIIVEDNPNIKHSYSNSSNLDDHSITGLSGSSRLYYLLFAVGHGTEVSSTLAGDVMDRFLATIALPNRLSWLSVTPFAGTTARGKSSPVALKFDSAKLGVGIHTANLRFTSNASNSAVLDVPISLQITPPDLEASPSTLDLIQIQNQTAVSQVVNLTALPGSSPIWTASTTEPWIRLSKTTGSGTDQLEVSFDPFLTAGIYQSKVTISYTGATFDLPVTLTVRSATYTQLLTDYGRPRMLGLIRGLNAEPSLLVGLHPNSLAVQTILRLPTDITDADITTDGKLLYAISFAERSISEVDLGNFSLERTQAIPAPNDAGRTAPYHYHVEAGRPGTVYYTDAATNPKLHVFDFVAGNDLSTFTLNSGAGIGDLLVTPDGSSMYAWSQTGWGLTGSSTLARIDCSTATLHQISVSAATLSQAPLDTPVLYSAARDAVITKTQKFKPDLSNSQTFPSSSFYAASAYGTVLASVNQLIDSTTGAILQSFNGSSNGVQAFTGDQTGLCYLHATSGLLTRLEVPNLSAAEMSPRLTDGGLLPSAPASLLWNGSPLAASYDVYFGNDSVAVATENNRSSGTSYRGNTQATSFAISSSAFQLGQTYYWRIDIRNLDGSTVKGPVWSFRLSVASPTPLSVSAASLRGNTAAVSSALAINTAQNDTAWVLSENTPWLSLSAASGVGPSTTTLHLNPTGLAAGVHTAQISLKSGADTVSIPVTFRLLGTLNIVKMEADPSLPRIYALHADLSNPSEAWLLWIDPVTARIDQFLQVGLDATDFAVHAADDRLYVLTQNGSRLISVQRQQTPQITHSLTLVSPAIAVHNGPVGRVITRNAAHTLQMLNSVTGGAVGSGVNLANCLTRTSGGGNLLFAAVQQSTSRTGIERYTLNSSGISYSSASYWNGSLGGEFVVSGNGERAFYNQAVYSLNGNIALSSNLPAAIVSSSWNGLMAFSTTKSYSTGTQWEVLGTLPIASALMAATADQSRLVQFSPTTRVFTSIDPGAVALAPSNVDFGQVPLGSTQRLNMTVSNITSQDLTMTVSSTLSAFKVSATPVTIHAGQFAQISVSGTFSALGTLTGTLNFNVIGQTQLNRTATISAQVINIHPLTVDFSAGAPADNTQSSSSTYTEDGLVLTTPNQILRVGGNHINRPNNGTPHIAPLANQRPLTIRRSDNGIFHLYSVDLAEHSYLFASPKVIIFNGTKVGGASVTTSFSLDGITDSTGPLTDFETFTFPSSFRDLISAEVTIDVYALDNLVFEAAVGSTAASVSMVTTASDGSLDLDADGIADVWTPRLSLSTASQSISQRCFIYTRRKTIEARAVTLQASQDGQNWTSLTPEIDYSIETVTSDAEAGCETVRLNIPTAGDSLWPLRLTSSP